MADSANFAANLAQSPSIFEISAAELLDNLIYPALSKIFNFVGLKVNFNIFKNVQLRDDLAPLATFLLQFLYMKNRGGSFGESFYGLQRNSTETGKVLSGKQQILSATISTLLPYLEKKVKDRAAQHEETTVEKYFVKLLHAYNAVKTVHTFLYLIRFTESHSPIFRAMGLSLKYPPAPLKKDKTTLVILRSLEVIAFFLQFLQWWYTNNQRKKIGSLQNPENCKKLDPVEDGKCPICLQKIANPTASSISGYVYCWKCIATHLKENKSCPVSGYPMSVEDLIRIYDS